MLSSLLSLCILASGLYLSEAHGILTIPPGALWVQLPELLSDWAGNSSSCWVLQQQRLLPAPCTLPLTPKHLHQRLSSLLPCVSSAAVAVCCC
jgi:hypothetical protein